MNILYCASEVYPFAKTGGLADVAGSLPLALGKLKHQVLVIMPRYRGIRFRIKKLAKNVRLLTIKNQGYFDRAGLYGSVGQDYKDNLQRFTFFCEKVIEACRLMNFKPDIIHGNDWHTGLIPLWMKKRFKDDPFFKKSKVVFTIHNLAYQGVFRENLSQSLGVEDRKDLEWYGGINLLKGGIVYPDVLTTVSPTYAREIQKVANGCGFHMHIKRRKKSLAGILNGIDTGIWNPAQDKQLIQRYSMKTLEKKEKNKLWLQKTCGFPVDSGTSQVPLFGMVTRLVEQKGLDLLLHSFDSLLKHNLQFVLLGTGEKKYESFFKKMNSKYKGRVFCSLKFSGMLSSRIYAGSDFFLMPSRFEPCGLGQMISFCYGTIPVVREVGGFSDTVVNYVENESRGNGVVFKSYTNASFLRAIDHAIKLYAQPRIMRTLRERGMKQDYSWESSAKKYVKLYRQVVRAT